MSVALDDIIEEVTAFAHTGKRWIVETYDFRKGVAATVKWLETKGVTISVEGIEFDVPEQPFEELKRCI